MVVIADTSPLNYLVLIEQAEVLPKLYGEIVIPQSVLEELLHPSAPQAVARWIACAPSWLIVERNIPSFPGLLADLDLGEREALALALAKSAGRFSLDRRRERA
jgi:predicted nucleic acid-binding protein